MPNADTARNRQPQLVKITPEEREAMDRASLIASIPHTMAEFALEDGEIDWDEFEENAPELYHEYWELSVEEIDQCLAEAYKSGGAARGYGEAINALREHREETVNATTPLFY